MLSDSTRAEMPIHITIATVVSLLAGLLKVIDEVKDNDEAIITLRRAIVINKPVVKTLSTVLSDDSEADEVVDEMIRVVSDATIMVTKYRNARVWKWLSRSFYDRQIKNLQDRICNCVATLTMVTCLHLCKLVPEYANRIAEQMQASNEDEGPINIQEQIAESIREMRELKTESTVNLQLLHAEFETA